MEYAQNMLDLPFLAGEHDGEHGHGDGEVGDEVVRYATEAAEWPMATEHEDEIENGVEQQRDQVADGQVEQEHVGDRVQCLVSADRRYHDQIGHYSHADH